MPPDFSFKGGMDASLPTAATTFGASDTVTTKTGQNVPVISVSDMTDTTKRALGGSLDDAGATVSVFKEVATEFHLVKGQVLNVRSVRMRILDIKPRLNDSITLICGPEASSARP